MTFKKTAGQSQISEGQNFYKYFFWSFYHYLYVMYKLVSFLTKFGVNDVTTRK